MKCLVMSTSRIRGEREREREREGRRLLNEVKS
jgi:hypothetical protein